MNQDFLATLDSSTTNQELSSGCSSIFAQVHMHVCCTHTDTTAHSVACRCTVLPDGVARGTSLASSANQTCPGSCPNKFPQKLLPSHCTEECRTAVMCYSSCCIGGQLSLKGACGGCAAVYGKCDDCFPNSACRGGRRKDSEFSGNSSSSVSP